MSHTSLKSNINHCFLGLDQMNQTKVLKTPQNSRLILTYNHLPECTETLTYRL